MPPFHTRSGLNMLLVTYRKPLLAPRSKTVRIKVLVPGNGRKRPIMMSLILLVVVFAMIGALLNRKKLGYGFFALSMILGLFWFHHHATSQLDILL